MSANSRFDEPICTKIPMKSNAVDTLNNNGKYRLVQAEKNSKEKTLSVCHSCVQINVCT